MGILSLLRPKSKKQFVSEIDFITNRDRQSHLAIETLVQLRDFSVEEVDELKIDYFFYTNSMEKATGLVNEMACLNYIVNYEVSADNKKIVIITGQTTPIRMMHEKLKNWAVEMCELGYRYDCDFEGWEIASS